MGRDEWKKKKWTLCGGPNKGIREVRPGEGRGETDTRKGQSCRCEVMEKEKNDLLKVGEKKLAGSARKAGSSWEGANK